MASACTAKSRIKWGQSPFPSKRGRASMFDPAAQLLSLTGPRPHVAVAFSGGIDSTVLAHALAKRRRSFTTLRLLHVDHGLQAASHDWSRHCARVARSLRLPFVALEATIRRRPGESPEAAARDA